MKVTIQIFLLCILCLYSAVVSEGSNISAQVQFVIKGRQLLLNCQYNASPPVSEVQWQKNGTVIARNHSVEINDSRVTIPHYNESQVQLVINATTPQDTGNYTCLVINNSGNLSDTASIIIQEPDFVPQNVRGWSTGSTSILVMWDEVPADQQNGNITGYNITYKSQTENDNGNVQVNGSVRQTDLKNLKEHVNYNITVFATTVKGDGPASGPIIVRTDQDKPDGAPQNVTGHNSSSTSILVMWDEVPADQQNGIITGYTIAYHSQTEHDSGSVLADPNVRQKELTGLKEYVNYNITVFASTVKGDGPASDPTVVRTNEDRPSAPPQDLQLKDSTSTSLLVGWNEVPAEDKNGIIISYTVSYQAISSALVKNLTVYFPTREVNLTGLMKNMNYSIRVLASTDEGDGNNSNPVFFVTNQDDVPTDSTENKDEGTVGTSKTIVVLATVLGLLVFVVVVVAGGIVVWRRLHRNAVTDEERETQAEERQ